MKRSYPPQPELSAALVTMCWMLRNSRALDTPEIKRRKADAWWRAWDRKVRILYGPARTRDSLYLYLRARIGAGRIFGGFITLL